MPSDPPTARTVIAAARDLCAAVERLSFAPPVTHVYNPLRYAWKLHESYLRAFATSPKRVVMLGMNPGPWGMAQTGVPFGEVAAVRDWMRLRGELELKNDSQTQHAKRPLEGLDCSRSEVSGRRLWGLMQERFGKAEAFFADHFVINYCPLMFMESTARNRTPDKLPADERRPLEEACDDHLIKLLETLKPQYAVGIGKYAESKLKHIRPELSTPLAEQLQIAAVLHPSPASPAANRGWAEAATRQFVNQEIWPA